MSVRPSPLLLIMQNKQMLIASWKGIGQVDHFNSVGFVIVILHSHMYLM